MSERIIVLMTPEQAQTLNVVARLKNTDKAKIIREAMENYIGSFFGQTRPENHQDSGNEIANGDAA